MKSKSVPKIRFKGFTEEWGGKIFKDIVDRSSITCNDTELYRVEYEDIISGQGVLNKDISQKVNNKTGMLFNPGDILFGKLRPYLRNYLLANFKGIALGDFWILNSSNNDSSFIYTLIQCEMFQIVANTSTGTKMPRSDWAFVSTSEFVIPDSDEQLKIGNYFQNLDDLIVKNEQQLTKLQNIKKACLEKMFPKNGSTTPEIRFKGFTGEWKEIKVNEIFRVTRGFVLAAPETSPTRTDKNKYPVFSSQTKNNGLMGYYYDYLYSNAITWTTDGANAGTVNFRHGKFYCTNVCGVLLSDEGYANNMVAEVLNRIAWKHVSKVGNPKLMNNVMSEIVVTLSNNIDEHNKISNLFIALDNLMIKNEQQLTKLKNIKKACLEKMFVNTTDAL